MSVEIHVKPRGAGVRVGSGSILFEILRNTFGGFPLALGEADLAILRAMSRASRLSADTDPYIAIADEIEKHGYVTVEALQ